MIGNEFDRGKGLGCVEVGEWRYRRVGVESERVELIGGWDWKGWS